MLKQNTCTAYVNVQQKVHRTAQLSQTANKYAPPLPPFLSLVFTAESTPYLVNEDAVGQGLPTCSTTWRVCRDRDRRSAAGSTMSSCLSTGQLITSTYIIAAFFSVYVLFLPFIVVGTAYTVKQWRTEGGFGVFNPPRNSESPPKSCQTQPDCENC